MYWSASASRARICSTVSTLLDALFIAPSITVVLVKRLSSFRSFGLGQVGLQSIFEKTTTIKDKLSREEFPAIGEGRSRPTQHPKVLPNHHTHNQTLLRTTFYLLQIQKTHRAARPAGPVGVLERHDVHDLRRVQKRREAEVRLGVRLEVALVVQVARVPPRGSSSAASSERQTHTGARTGYLPRGRLQRREQ